MTSSLISMTGRTIFFIDCFTSMDLFTIRFKLRASIGDDLYKYQMIANKKAIMAENKMNCILFFFKEKFIAIISFD